MQGLKRFHLPKVKLRCDTRFQRAFTACSCVFKLIILIGSNQGNYFENATAWSKCTLKTTVATQLYWLKIIGYCYHSVYVFNVSWPKVMTLCGFYWINRIVNFGRNVFLFIFINLIFCKSNKSLLLLWYWLQFVTCELLAFVINGHNFGVQRMILFTGLTCVKKISALLKVELVKIMAPLLLKILLWHNLSSEVLKRP